MAATLSLDTITSSGSTITVPTGKTLAITDTSALTVGGTAISTGSSNILRKTTDYTILEADVSGKSELVIAANAASSNRTITLPAVATTGLANCIVTIICDADATSTYELKIQDSGTTEVWTGYQTGDFVRLIVSNSAWLVVDHKETYYSYRWLTASATIGTSATTKLTGWTNVIDIGNVWDNANNKLTTPTGMNGFWLISWNNSTGTETNGVTPTVQLAGNSIMKYAHASGTSGYLSGQDGTTGKYYATSAQDVEFFATNMRSDYTHVILGGGQSTSHFTAQFERVY